MKPEHLDREERRHERSRAGLAPAFCRRCDEEWPCLAVAIIDYARERAAREACEAAGPKPGLVSLTAIANADDTCRYWAEWSVPFRTLVGVEASTPTNAYLALFAKLTK